MHQGRSLAVLVGVVGVLLVGAGAAQAAPGDLDTSFGQNGIASIDLGHSAFGNAVLAQPDGKVVVAGTAISIFGSGTDVVAARFTQQGAPDPSFGDKGKGFFQPDFGQDETGYGAALQPDGKIIIAGDSTPSSGPTQLLATRFTDSGTLDTTFGGGSGKSENNFGLTSTSLFGRGMALEPGGQILIAGYTASSSATGALIARLDNAGTPDNTFDAGSPVSTLGSPQTDSSLAAVTFAKDGTVFGAGEVVASIGQPANFFTAEQKGSGGGTHGDDLGGDDRASAVVVQPDGKIVVAGYSNAKGNYDFVVERFNSLFDPDTSFGTAGKEFIDLGGNDSASGVVVQPDGKIVVAGTTGSQIGVVRLLANGQPDPSFGHNGIATVGSAGAKLQAGGVDLAPNGDIVVGGTITPAGSKQKNLLAVRLHGDNSNSSGGGSGGGGGGGGTTTTGAPALSGVSVSKSSFHRASFLPKLNPTGKSKGTVISATVSTAAQLTLTFSKSAPGRRVNGHCVAPAKSNHSKPHCTRHVTKGTLTLQAKAGANTIAFGGTLTTTQKLPPGTYTLTITATANGATSTPTTLTITIKH